MYDVHLRDFQRLANENDDSGRIQRAIDVAGNGILYIPKGDYALAAPLVISNRCSLRMHPAARLVAQAKMDFVLTYDGCANYHALSVFDEDGRIYDNLGLHIEGGDIDGNGMASCLRITNAHHFTLKDTSLHNGKQYGLCIGGDQGHIYELICSNVYCKCTMPGLAGNIGIYSDRSDCHYTDCIVVDYTIGMQMLGSANRLTRCHIWGGTVAPDSMSMKEWSDTYALCKRLRGAGIYDSSAKDVFDHPLPQMLKNSIAFDMKGVCNVLDGCYADTAEIGYLLENDTRLMTCDFFNNPLMGLKKSTAIKHTRGAISVAFCAFRGPVGTEKLYEGEGQNVTWLSNTVQGDGFALPAFAQEQ